MPELPVHVQFCPLPLQSTRPSGSCMGDTYLHQWRRPAVLLLLVLVLLRCAAPKPAAAAEAADVDAAALLLCPLRPGNVCSGQLLPAGAEPPLRCRHAAELLQLQAVARQKRLCGDQDQTSRLAVRASELPHGRSACC